MPEAKILLLGVFPRSEKSDDPLRKVIQGINGEIAKLDDGQWIKYLDIGEKFLDANGICP